MIIYLLITTMYGRTLIPLSIKGRNVAITFCLLMVLAFAYTPNFAQTDDDETPTDAIAVFEEGQTLHEKGDLAGAIKLYNKAIEAMGDFPEAEYQKGVAYIALNDLGNAEKSFRTAIKDRPEWSLAVAMLGDVLVRKYSIALDRKDKDAATIAGEATELLTTSIKTDENNFPAYTALTELAIRSGSPRKQLSDLLFKIRSITDGKMKVPSSIWTARAALENAVDERAAARSSLKRALQIDSANKNAIKLAAELALFDFDVEQAIAYTDALERLSPGEPSTKLLYAKVYAAQGKFAEARRQLELIKVPMTEADTLRSKLNSLTNKSPAELEAALVNSPKDASILSKLCSANRVDAPEKALDYCRRANEIEPNNIDHAIGYAAALVQARRFELAVSILEKVKPIAPDNATVRVNLASALYQLKRYSESKAEYQWIAERQSDRPIAFFLLAVVHDQLAEYIDAMANYQQFLRIADPVQNALEIDKVKLRLPSLEKQVKEMKRK